MGLPKDCARFLFEMSTLRFVQRAHRQKFLVGDQSDSIAAHSHITAVIGLLLAMEEGLGDAEVFRVVTMCLLHDSGEARTGDHNHLHKRYVVVDDALAKEEQFGQLPAITRARITGIMAEYERRDSLFALMAKDADDLAQVVLIKEYIHAGSGEAREWFSYASQERKRERLRTAVGRRFFDELCRTPVSAWWHGLSTRINRRLEAVRTAG